MTKKTCLLRLFACLLPAVTAAGLNAQELIANGNFEGTGLAPWQVSAPAGTSATAVTDNSPFRSVYPAGTRGLRITDDDSEFEAPSLSQTFAAQAGVRFSFDFKADAAAPGSPWYVIWSGDESTTAFFFSVGGQDGASIELNQSKVADLQAGLWYHVEGIAGAPQQQINGTIQSAGGEPVPFTAGFPFGVQQVINGVSITDGDQAANGAIVFDNFSAQPATVTVRPTLNIVPEPEGQVTISWAGAGYVLQASTEASPNAQWTTIPTSGQTFTTQTDDPPNQFFRLISQ